MPKIQTLPKMEKKIISLKVLYQRIGYIFLAGRVIRPGITQPETSEVPLSYMFFSPNWTLKEKISVFFLKPVNSWATSST